MQAPKNLSNHVMAFAPLMALPILAGALNTFYLAGTLVLIALTWRRHLPLAIGLQAFPFLTLTYVDPLAPILAALLAALAPNLWPLAAGLVFGLCWGISVMATPMAFPLGLLMLNHLPHRLTLLAGIIGLGAAYGLGLPLSPVTPWPANDWLLVPILLACGIAALSWVSYFRLRRRDLQCAHPVAALVLSGLVALIFSLIAHQANWSHGPILASALGPFLIVGAGQLMRWPVWACMLSLGLWAVLVAFVL